MPENPDAPKHLTPITTKCHLQSRDQIPDVHVVPSETGSGCDALVDLHGV